MCVYKVCYAHFQILWSRRLYLALMGMIDDLSFYDQYWLMGIIDAQGGWLMKEELGTEQIQANPKEFGREIPFSFGGF